MSTPLRPDDPRRLGGYHLHARLGEGGMGAVFLAHDADDRRVAIKLIRPELAADPAFRARFRSEVRRARQVPPFCTAAVLDADPEHPTPYLVVEYVEGASLEEMVRRDGPLRGGALHSVAIGVATALAAIHSAGVIHRDLKPANVLLSLGTPKVIDFGIARAAEAPTEHTRPDQMVGTIAYMAPERFETGEARAAAGPAMDVFAWGVLVAYAATGTTPFAADSPVATAARILTQPPDLDGLDGPMRDLVLTALAKNPEERPSAHDLLTLLLAVGASLAEQPQVQWAALAMRNNAEAEAARAEDAEAAWAWVARRRRRSRRLRTMAAVTVLAVLAIAAGAGVAAVLADQPRPDSTSALSMLTVADPLSGPGLWQPASSSGPSGGCTFAWNGLVASRTTGSLYRCPGPDMHFANPIVAVDIALPFEGECAAVWLRVGPQGAYRIAVCADRLTLVAERPFPGEDSTITTRSVSLGNANGDPYRGRLTVLARDRYIEADLDGETLIHTRLAGDFIEYGWLALGVVRDDTFRARPTGTPDSGLVHFANVQVWEP
ncbi:hypothetical protein FB565_003632 [Actinoplanes lutulentus]|uniref:serine/threonine-protein kinase n=1 Tax=Actinoplanes lutulentus TaxID=1287878 RepID=UPI000DB9C460|nr:serine/threonine-protein kinase [Actinoplanes lutulentus]MBB2943903.1 hypothetical protein [Actinoplanes lutulentus]